jgi:hypothetical protein
MSLNESNFNSPNIIKRSVAEELKPNQQPLGTQFRSYELTAASNYWTLDPFQYSITKFKYNLPIDNESGSSGITDFKNDPGLIYKNVDFDKLLPAYTSTKKSVNDFSAQSYHRFTANEGYFNPYESINNQDLWYYLADSKSNGSGVGGPPLNVQEINHIIFPEPQRGGLNSKSVSKYSSSNIIHRGDKVSWGSQNFTPVNNDKNCAFFSYNSGYNSPRNTDFNKVYTFDSDYCKSIGISSKYEGSMPFNPKVIY